ncbi:unnamed protein product [Caretta caretta]
MDPAAEDSWRLEWGDRVYFSYLTVHTAGVVTLFSPDLRPEVLGVAEVLPGRLLHLHMEGACWEKWEELRALDDHRARGAFVRSRIHLLGEMDRDSRFFYSLEKKRGAKKHVTCLLLEDGTLLTDPAEMCERAENFYAHLFSPDPTNPTACRVLWDGLPMVSAGDRDWLELPLSLAEFSEVPASFSARELAGFGGQGG